MNELCVVIPTLNDGRTLADCLEALGEVGQVIVVDGGSSDATVEIARGLGATVVRTEPGRGIQRRAGTAVAEGDWLLMLHADTLLQSGWQQEVAAFIAEPANALRAAVFRFAVDDWSRQARWRERMVWWRGHVLGLPYGDQGLLIGRRCLEDLGGYQPLPVMEDADLVRRIGRARLSFLNTRAVSSGETWPRAGRIGRSARNLLCLLLLVTMVPADRIAKFYNRQSRAT